MSNRDRILAASQQLMNLSGSETVTTNQVCEALGISPGNLYYHFKNKEEIVRALFQSLRTDFMSAFDVDSTAPVTPAVFAGYYIRTLDVAYDYRFFFSSLQHLLRKDKVLGEQYRELQQWALQHLADVARRVAKQGQLSVPNTPKRYQTIATNTWLIWSNWVRHLEISKGTIDVSRLEMIEGIDQIFDVLSGHLDPAFERAVRRQLSQAKKRLA